LGDHIVSTDAGCLMSTKHGFVDKFPHPQRHSHASTDSGIGTAHPALKEHLQAKGD
jgi:hypothetical protein